MSIIFRTQPIAGDTWLISLQNWRNYPSLDTFKVVFASGTSQMSDTGVLVGTGIEFGIPAVDTAQFPVGPCSIVFQAFDTASPPNRFTIERGGCNVMADISAEGADVNAQTMLQQQLAACDQTLLSILGTEVSMTQFGGQAYTLQNISDLYKVRNNLQIQVDEEQQRMLGNKRSRLIKARFVGGQFIPMNPWGLGGW